MHHSVLLVALLALALFLILPWQWALPLYVPLLIGVLFVEWKAIQAQRRPATTGENAMLGRMAVVARGEGTEVEVRVQGETWRAVSDRPVHRGQHVIIEDVKGLTLYVAPAPLTEAEHQITEPI